MSSTKHIELILHRIAFQTTYTIGRLYIDGTYFCDTLEPTDRRIEAGGVKIKGQTAIPRGKYDIVMYTSRKHGRVPLLLDVPQFSGILIHTGNYPHHTRGCILVGENTVVGSVWSSQYYLDRLVSEIKQYSSITITIC